MPDLIIKAIKGIYRLLKEKKLKNKKDMGKNYQMA